MDDQHFITINGNRIHFNSGETILNIARRKHIDIPTLCYLRGASPTGTCNVCMVELAGEKELVKACETQAVPDMVVLTESPRVVAARQYVIKKLMGSGNHNCAVRGADATDWAAFQLKVNREDKSEQLCPVWGDCRLQDLAYRYQVSGENFNKSNVAYFLEDANPFIVRDFSRCILCGRCVSACNDVQVNNAIQFRADKGKVVTGEEDRPLKDSRCVFCGECIQACPVGALVEKDVRYRVRPWETRKVRTTCSYCGVGCQIYLHVKDGKVVKVSGVEGVGPNYGSLCVKGRFGFDFINSEARLTKPLIKENGKHREATWDEALGLVAEKLSRIRDASGPDSIGVLTSARITNEENYVVQKFARAVLKTNNVDHCARL
jgi:predicted molibdopterin-dependent oxidoreductase YjgC